GDPERGLDRRPDRRGQIVELIDLLVVARAARSNEDPDRPEEPELRAHLLRRDAVLEQADRRYGRGVELTVHAGVGDADRHPSREGRARVGRSPAVRALALRDLG